MLRRLLSVIIAGSLSFTACSGFNLGDWQWNRPDPNFTLFAIFDDYPALSAMWDSIDGERVNDSLGATIRNNEEEFIQLAGVLIDLMQGDGGTVADRPLPSMLSDLSLLLKDLNGNNMLNDTQSDPRWYNYTGGIDAFYDDGQPSTAHYRQGFYQFLDNASKRPPRNIPGVGESLIPVMESIVNYTLDEEVDGTDYTSLRDAMNDLMSAVQNEDFNEDYVDLMEALSKMLIKCDHPMWIDGTGDVITDYALMSGGTNTGLGNLVRGVFAIMSGMLQMDEYNPAQGPYEPIDRDDLYETLLDVRDNILRDPANPGEMNTPVLRAMIENLERYFTVGGSAYGAAPTDANASVTANIYNTRNNFHTGTPGAFYSDSELRNVLKEVVNGQVGLFLREDRDGAVSSDAASRDYFFKRMIDSASDIDWENARVEESLYDLLRYDVFGRDRVNDASAYPASFLESFLFLGGVTSNLGYKHAHPYDSYTLEVSSSDANSAQGEARRHGHGEFMGTISLNDSLQSITGVRDELGSVGTYELAFEGSTQRWNYIFRSKNRFNQSNKNNFKFRYDYNYPALAFMPGACTGDMGLPTGGNPSGGDGEILNNYMPYVANGVGNAIASGWTLGNVMRATWEGEGPYYYDPEKANRAAEIITINGRLYNVYYRLNGKVYAYVHKPEYNDPSTWEYIYPADSKRDAQEVASFTGYPEMTFSELITTAPYPVAVAGSGSCGGGEPERFGIVIKIGEQLYAPIIFDGGVDTSWTRNEVRNAIINRIDTPNDPDVAVTDVGTTAIRITSSRGAITVFDYGTFTQTGVDGSSDPIYSDVVLEGGLERFVIDNITTPYYEAPAWINLASDATVDVEINGANYSIPYEQMDGATVKDWTLSAIVARANEVLPPGSITTTINGFTVTGSASSDLGSLRISGSGAQEIFGVEDDEFYMANGRTNRYRDTWQTDYYMITSTKGKSYTPLDMSGNALSADALTYHEIISEEDPGRACASQEEALFRNYQYVTRRKSWSWSYLFFFQRLLWE
jgi:hypothetical protein